MARDSRRKRSRIACVPCRERKRKCDSEDPCSTCSSWGYECHYRPKLRKGQDASTSAPHPARMVSDSASRPRGQMSQTTAPGTRGYAESVKANSGALFVRQIGLKVDPANAPKLNLFGWNVGTRRLPSGSGSVSVLPIVDIIALEDIRVLAEVYFTKVDPCYGFIDSHDFFQRLDKRWEDNLVEDTYDGVLAGVAALGSLFSHRTIDITELHLVELARSLLDMHVGYGPPSADLVTAWALRVIYLRMTAPPYPTWIASCTLMHLVDASSLHQESSGEVTAPVSARSDLDTRRRLVGVAQHLNLWTSYDLGLSRVLLSDGPVLLPLPRTGDYTLELLRLLPISTSLAPENSNNDKDLEALLLQTLDGVHTQAPSILAQCNLVLCLLRRLRMTTLTSSPGTIERVLRLFRTALGAASSMASNCCPWQHVANVPFQMVSVLLEMDTSAALGILPEAMQTLKSVASIYDTDAMRKAYTTARLLILLYQRRRCEDVKMLSSLLREHRQQLSWKTPPTTAIPPTEGLSWLEDLVVDVPSLQGIDFHQFWDADVTNVAQYTDLFGATTLV